jgi:hypothetical protein
MQSLRDLRRRARDARAQQLAARLHRLEAAQQAALAARAARQREFDDHRQAEAAERSRIHAGPTRVADLAALDHWRRAADEREAVSNKKVSDAERAVGAERSETEMTRRALAVAEAEANVLERHHQGWLREEAQRAERTAEEEAAETWLSRVGQRHRRRGSQ